MVCKVSSQYLEWTGRNKIERAADSDFKDNGFQILEMNIEEDYIRMLINCTPQHYIPNIIKAMKGVSARLLMKEFGDDLRSKLWGGHLWNPSYFVATVSENTEEQIIDYIRSQKRK